MNAVSEDVAKLVEKELANANKQFPAFASEHEAWAVMHEMGIYEPWEAAVRAIRKELGEEEQDE